MRFLIDECLHESLVGVTHSAGLEAAHVINSAVEVSLDYQVVRCVEYLLPTD
jgi:predicted nuclease of predicted toxin-antitoxin system